MSKSRPWRAPRTAPAFVSPLAGRQRHDRQLGLVAAARDGDEAARSQLVTSYKRLAYQAANRYAGGLATASLDVDDLAQLALAAVNRCIEKFDLARPKATFAAYAKAAIQREVMDASARNGDVVLSSYTAFQYLKWRDVYTQLHRAGPVTMALFAEAVGVPTDQVRDHWPSLVQSGATWDAVPPLEALPDERDTIEDEVTAGEQSEALELAMAALSHREVEVLRRMASGQPYVRALALEWGVSDERVGTIRDAARTKLQTDPVLRALWEDLA